MARRGNTWEEVLRFKLETEGDKELDKLADGLRALGDSSDESAGQAQQLLTELEKLVTTSSNIRQFTALKATIADTGTQLEKAKTRMAELAAEVDRTDKPTQKLNRALQRAGSEVERLSKLQNRQSAALGAVSGALSKAGVDTEKLGAAYQDAQADLDAFAKRSDVAAMALDRSGKQSEQAATGVGKLGKAAAASSRSLTSIAARLTAVSGAATVAIKGLAALSGATLFKGGLESALELEQALAEVQAVSGATREELEALKAAAEAGGAATRFSTLEAAQGLGELARATGSAQAAIAALPSTLSLAQAAGFGVAESAQLITTTLTQYGLAADQAARVSDVLAQAANTTTADVQGLGNALSYAAPLAKILGLDLEQTTAIIGALADQGFRGERAGTALRSVFSEMLDPASDFGKALRELGIETTDFTEIIEQLGKKGQLGQDALLKLDAAARPAILALVNSGGAALRQLDADLRGAAGAAEETAAIMGRNLSGAAEQIKDTFDRTRRSLVEPLLEPLRVELLYLADELETFAASPAFAELKESLTDLFTEAALAVRSFLQETDFEQLARKIRDGIGDAGEAVTEFKENLGEIVTVVATVGNAFDLLFNSVQSGILLLAAALSQIVSLGAHLADSMSTPQRKLLEFLGLMGEGQVDLKEFAGGMNAVAQEFGDRFAKNVDEAAAAAARLANTGAEAGAAAASGVGKAGEAAGAAAGAVTMLEEVVVTASAALREQGAAAGEAAATTSAATAQIEQDTTRLKQAYADMGITSQVELDRAADAARKNFELIRQAVSNGTATAADARRAFQAYAAAARAAVADSDASAKARVEAELRVLEAAVGVTAGLDEMGDAGRRAGAKIGDGAAEALRRLRELQQQAGATSQAATAVADGAEKAGEGTKAAAKATTSWSAELKGLTPALVNAYLAMNRYAGTDFWSKGMNRITADFQQQADALARLNEELDRNLAKYDPLTKEMEKLKAQYPYLEEAQLRATAEKQQRLHEEAQRQKEDAQRLRDEAARAAEEARQAQTQARGEAAAAGANLSQPIEDVLRIEWTAPSRSTATAASAAEAEQAERMANLVAPLVLRRIERAKSVSIMRRPGG